MTLNEVATTVNIQIAIRLNPKLLNSFVEDYLWMKNEWDQE